MIHRFESFELDTDRYELRLRGKPVAVEPQVFSVLTMLVENRHRMVRREEIIEAVWSGRAVSDSVLSSRIKSARQALDDDGNAQRLIRTVHGQGFRFVGAVESVESVETVPSATSAPTAAQAWVREVLARPILAVLPFETDETDETDLTESRAAGDAYFADGVAEELIAELASWRWFPILSRDSSFDKSHAGLKASARATALGARYAVAGRLARGGGACRLSVELLDAATDTQLWSARYDVRAAEFARMQSEIVSEIFRRIAPELTSEETRRVMRKRHEDLTAWDLTIKGLWHMHRQDFPQALALLEDATRVDPGFALPWSVIAQTRLEQALAGWKRGQRDESHEAFRGLLEAASTAVELDPSSWMGHTLMSAAELWVNLSFPRARLHANRALELNPSASMAHHVSGCIWGFAGDLDAAIAEQGNVFRVDPRYGHAEVVQADLGLWHLLRGDLEQAAEHLRRSVSLDPSNLRAWQRQIILAGMRGDAVRAREAFRALEKLGGTMDEGYLAVSYPFQDSKHAEAFRAGLRAAEALRG
jgi:DNA-binding winged helix-turn-helix (wHTH) protein/tetratricopeptide (TPR) repeat protein